MSPDLTSEILLNTMPKEWIWLGKLALRGKVTNSISKEALYSINSTPALSRRIEYELSFIPIIVNEIKGGQNNRIFLISDRNGEKLILKFYAHDERHRLDREFTAYDFLHSQGIINTPNSLLREDSLNCAVYSFEEGQIKGSAQYDAANIRDTVDFILKWKSLIKPH